MWLMNSLIVGYLPFLLIHLWANQVNCSDNSTQLLQYHQNKLLIERQTHLITSGFSAIFWNYLRNLNDSTTINGVSNQCSSSLDKIIQSTLNGQVWAFKFISFSGSRPTDFLDGSYATFGSYDSCLEFNQLTKSSNQSETIKGQYCLTSLEPDLLRNDQSESQLLSELYSHHLDSQFNLTIKFGLCLPSTCSQGDVQQLVNQALNDYNWKLVDVNQCEVLETFFDRYSSATIGVKIFFWLLVSLIVTIIWGTLIDYQAKSSTNELDSKSNHIFWIKQFSAIKSVRSLFRKPDCSPKIILLDQLRLTCVMIVVSLHAVMWFTVINAGFLVENTRKGIELYKRFEIQPIANDWITEGLIVVGGLSSATVLIKKTTPQTPISTYLYLIWRRAALLIPPIITVISLEIVLPLFGSGPFFKSVNQFRSTVCLKNFIFNILHLQNYCEPLEICASHTWSIAVEWQLFILLTVAIYIYKRNYRAGLAFNLFLIVVGFNQVNQVILRHNIIPHILITSARFRDIAARMGAYYVSTESHIWSYFLGLLLLIIMLGNYESKLGIIITKLRYKVSIGLTIVLSFTSLPWNTFGMPIESVTTIISSTIIKILMALWCSMLVFPHGKKFRSFLADSKSNDIYIYSDVENENLNGEQLKANNELISERDNEKSSANNNNNNNNVNLNNNQKTISTINQFKSSANFKSLHRFEIILRLYKSTYFIHTIVYAFHFTTLRTSLTYSLKNYLMIMTTLTATALLGGLFFHILIIGPIERIQYILSRKPIKSKTL
ncbi:nose resistant to fluoxetine protein 6-like [Panonychus citri]|uniref:nose resistant to fluoxetine protein 6-like n=1 Tax=Panonychus citri TaxID=50023 RepID=UPI0023071B3F|nr:nose resistant to fluoxetine protein 6-like [Panonychus citri]XP_053208294.1 nose resistant to fluoxetine protein 6-like [Panonychus citri]